MSTLLIAAIHQMLIDRFSTIAPVTSIDLYDYFLILTIRFRTNKCFHVQVAQYDHDVRTTITYMSSSTMSAAAFYERILLSDPDIMSKIIYNVQSILDSEHSSEIKNAKIDD